jgi:acyl-CoA thioesterase FadM
MYNDVSGKMVATSDCVAVQASLDQGKSVALSAELRERAQGHLVSANVPINADLG